MRTRLRSLVPFTAGVLALCAIPAPARVGPTVRQLVEVSDVEALAASPDGTKVAFLVQRASAVANSYRIEWFVADLSSGSVQRVADGGDPIYNDGAIESAPPVWSPDGRAFYHRALVDGAIGIWRTAADGSGSRLVVGGPADVESLAASDDGGSLSYVTGPTREEIRRAQQDEYDDGILVDGSVDPTQALYRGAYVHGHLASQRLVGRWYEHDGLLWRAPRVRHELDFATMRERRSEVLAPAAKKPLTVNYSIPDLTASAGAARASLVDSGTDRQRLEASDGPNQPWTCATGPCRSARIVALLWTESGKQVLFTAQDSHFRQSLYLWDPKRGGVRLVFAGAGQLSGGRAGTIPCAAAGHSVVCVAAAAASAPELLEIPLTGRRPRLLFDPNSELRTASAPRVEQLSWTLGDGRTATGTLLFDPMRTPSRAPLFVNYYYCSGYLRGGVGDAYPFSPLVDAGFVVACLNIVPFKTWGDGAERERSALASVKSLVGLLTDRGWIDPSRVSMGGYSAGSEATMWTAMNSDLLAATAVASPQYEPSDYWLSSVRGRDVPQVLRDFQQLRSPDEDPARWKLISPALNVDRIKAPLLMQLPEQEMRAAIELYARLSNTATPVEMYAFPDEAHMKIQPRHQLAVYRRNLEWFRYWLQGYVDPDPARAAQYQRWELLRQRQSSRSIE